MIILTLASNRHDFIEIQLKSMKHIKNPFEWIILDNERYGNEIKKECQRLNIKTIKIPQEDKNYVGDYFSVICGYAWNYAWKFISHLDGIIFYLDCDFFFMKDIDLEKFMENTEMAYWPRYTNEKEWPSPSCILFNNLQSPAEIDFGFFPIDDIHSDVGSAMYKYLDKYQPKVKYLKSESPLEEPNKKLDKLGFPHPYSFDYYSFDEKPVLFHYKTSSNYSEHCTPEYNREKTRAMLKLL